MNDLKELYLRIFLTGVCLLFISLISNDTFTMILSFWIFLVALIVFLLNKVIHKVQASLNNDGSEIRRKTALSLAKIYLLPYKDIWRNLTLSNKYCTLKLRGDGKTIVGTEKKSDKNLPYRKFKIINSKVHDEKELWNMFCTAFSHQTSYDGLLELCDTYKLSRFDDIVVPQQALTPNLPQTVQLQQPITDINNCSEIELTALPGISIVLAKKIIKKREELGGFKSVENFLDFLKLKSNITNQLRTLVCVNKMQGSLKIERFEERRVDL